MALLRVCASLAVLLATAHAVTPIEKVTSLLKDLKKEVEEEGKAEAAQYEKFACFCKDTTASKSKSIEDGQDKVDTTTADIGKKTATRKEKMTNRAKEQDKVEETTQKLQETTETYQKNKAEYEVTNADLTKAVTSAQRAHKILSSKKGAALLEMKSDVTNCLELAEALGMVEPSKHSAVTSFLQVDPDDPAYKFHSGQILKIIEDLRQDFADERKKVNDEWEKTDKAFKAERADLKDKIKTANAEIKKLTGEIDDLKSKIAQLNEDLINTNSALTDDSAYLRDLTTRCEEKATAWDQRTSLRHGEVEALTKAMKIMADGAKDADAVNKRALLLSHKTTPVAAPVAKAAAVKAPVKAVKPAAKPAAAVKAKAKKSLSFLQVQSRALATRDGTASFLRHEGARLGSTMLSSLAEQIMADPFVKIKQLIQGLIERLLEESKGEATKKGFCDTELGKSYADRKNRLADVNKLDTDISELEAHKGALTSEIAELTSDLKRVRADLKKATDLRKDEKAENEKTIKAAIAGAAAVGDALVVLKDFYKSAAKELLQVSSAASPIDEDNPGAGFDESYRGSQGKSKGILGLLEVIKSDYERTNTKTAAAEKEALEEFVAFDRASKADIASKDTKKSLDEQDLDSTKSAIDQGMKDLQTATDLLDGALKNVEDLKPTCLDTGMSYAERVQKREEEVKALKEALKALAPQ